MDIKHKLLVALLSGGGIASSLVLLLNVPAQIVAVAAFMLLLPGGVLATLMSRSTEFTAPLTVLAANALVYSVLVFIVLVALSRAVSTATVRLLALRLAIPALLLIGLACVPAFNPLWPRGMDQLSRKENGLREALPVGMGLDQARTVLRSKGIDFREETETSETIVLNRDNTNVAAEAGDRVVSARLETNASQFPCGYDMEVVLVFGRDEKMKTQYVHRLRICP